MNKETLIKQVVNVMETGGKEGDYGSVEVMNDGKGGSPQITYGRSCTTEQGNLKILLSSYVNAGGLHSDFIKLYLPNVGVIPMYSNKSFLKALQEAGSDPIMQRTQDRFFDEQYFKPAMEFCKKNNFQYWLSKLVVYDSYIHSGSILTFLRSRFSATPSVEKDWITSYLIERDSWLSGHSNRLLRNSSYRTKDYLKMIKDNNWNLDKPFQANGVEFL